MSRVFVVQNHMARDRETGGLKPRFDLSPARDYGELVHLLDSHDLPFRPASIIQKLRQRLAGFTAEDYLLLVGNPCFIGWAVTLAAQQTGGKIRLLQWHTPSQSYFIIEADLFDNSQGLPNE